MIKKLLMATLKELSYEYFIQIIESNNEEQEVRNVLKEINQLKYSIEKTYLSEEDKREIIKGIYDHLRDFQNGTFKLNESVRVQKSFSNDAYVKLIELVSELLKKK